MGWRDFLLGIVALGLGVLLALGGAAYSSLSQQADAANERSEANRVERERLSQDIDELRQQLLDLGVAPVAPPAGPVPELEDDLMVGPRGPRGPGPTATQVELAVLAILSQRPDLTRGEIVTAVANYLAANPAPAGANGDRGEPGRPPTSDEISAAVEDFCSDGACQGEPGPAGQDSTVPGPQGPAGADSTIPGPAGVGVTSIACPEDSNDWVITLSDGTEQIVEGPCRVDFPPRLTP